MPPRRLAALVIASAAVAALAAGCGDDDKQPETVTNTETVTSPAPSADAEEQQILAAARRKAPDATVKLVKTNGEFALTNAIDFHQILKKIGGTWTVIVEGNGITSSEEIERFDIPPEYANP